MSTENQDTECTADYCKCGIWQAKRSSSFTGWNIPLDTWHVTQAGVTVAFVPGHFNPKDTLALLFRLNGTPEAWARSIELTDRSKEIEAAILLERVRQEKDAEVKIATLHTIRTLLDVMSKNRTT